MAWLYSQNGRRLWWTRIRRAAWMNWFVWIAALECTWPVYPRVPIQTRTRWLPGPRGHLQRDDAFRTSKSDRLCPFSSPHGYILTARSVLPMGRPIFCFAIIFKKHNVLQIIQTTAGRSLDYMLHDGSARSLRPSLVYFSAASRAAAIARFAVAFSSRHRHNVSFAASGI
jgi:hypothetical protein